MRSRSYPVWAETTPGERLGGVLNNLLEVGERAQVIGGGDLPLQHGKTPLPHFPGAGHGQQCVDRPASAAGGLVPCGDQRNDRTANSLSLLPVILFRLATNQRRHHVVTGLGAVRASASVVMRSSMRLRAAIRSLGELTAAAAASPGGGRRVRSSRGCSCHRENRNVRRGAGRTDSRRYWCPAAVRAANRRSPLLILDTSSLPHS